MTTRNVVLAMALARSEWRQHWDSYVNNMIVPDISRGCTSESIVEVKRLLDWGYLINLCAAEVAKLDDRQLAQGARQMLRAALQRCPQQAGVFWLTAAHLAAYGELPQAHIHRLGHLQKLEALDFATAPPSSVNARVHAVLSMACGSGPGCLDLRPAAVVQLLARMPSFPREWQGQETLSFLVCAVPCLPLLTTDVIEAGEASSNERGGSGCAGHGSQLQVST